MRPVLVPGARLLRRPDGRLQVGLHPPRRAVLTDPAATPELDADASRLPPEALAQRHEVRTAGLVAADDHAVRSALPASSAGVPWQRHTLAALARESPDDFASTVAHRERHVVRVVPFGHPAGAGLAHDLLTLCARSGLHTPGRRRPGPVPKGSPPPQEVAALVGVGEPTRDLVDRWCADGVPHLLVRMTEGAAVVGPFVVPGRTACLRCVDGALTEVDPAWPLLVQQYASAVQEDRADGIPEPIDAALAALALAWAARDLASFAEGGTPATLGATVHIAPRLAAIETRRWHPHGRCGCRWA